MALQNQQEQSVGDEINNDRFWLVPYGCISGTKLEKLIAVETTETAKKVDSL
jgi:hypothetical protein